MLLAPNISQIRSKHNIVSPGDKKQEHVIEFFCITIRTEVRALQSLLQGVSSKVYIFNHTFSQPFYNLQPRFWAHFEEEGLPFMKLKPKLEKEYSAYMSLKLKINRHILLQFQKG